MIAGMKIEIEMKKNNERKVKVQIEDWLLGGMQINMKTVKLTIYLFLTKWKSEGYMRIEQLRLLKELNGNTCEELLKGRAMLQTKNSIEERVMQI